MSEYDFLLDYSYVGLLIDSTRNIRACNEKNNVGRLTPLLRLFAAFYWLDVCSAQFEFKSEFPTEALISVLRKNGSKKQYAHFKASLLI